MLQPSMRETRTFSCGVNLLFAVIISWFLIWCLVVERRPPPCLACACFVPTFVRRLPCWLKPYANHAIFTVSNCKRQSFSFAFIHRTGTLPIGNDSRLKRRVEESVGECTEETILRRRNHVEYLLKALDGLSAGFVGLDASKPWMCYWILHALDLLQHKIGTGLATRYILLKFIY
jgi:hypothetical protein